MKLNLQYPPDPEHAALLAALAVDAAASVDGITLDFGPQSLSAVDGIFESFRRAGLGERDIGETVFSFGCYVGEVLVRNLGGAWRRPEKTALVGAMSDPGNMMVVELPNGSVWNPIGKAFKLLANGPTDSVAHLYRVISESVA